MVLRDKAVKEFLELRTCSDKRIQKMKRILLNIKGMSSKPLNKLEIKDVAHILKKINEAEYTSWTKNDYKKIFKAFLKWKYKNLDMIEGDVVREAFKGVSKRRAFNHQRINKNTLIKPEELESLLRTAKSLKWKALISFMYESAFRPCEVCALRWRDLNFDDTNNLCRVTIVSPKTKDKREIPIRECIVHLKRWREEYQFPDRKPEDFVFPSQHKKDKPMGNGVIPEMFKRLCKSAKMRHIFPYILRHSRIYEIQKRLPEKIAAKFAGHSIETSEIYNHIADDDVEKSMLEKIYVTEELTLEEKTNLEKMKKEMIRVQQELQNIKEMFNPKDLKNVKIILRGEKK